MSTRPTARGTRLAWAVMTGSVVVPVLGLAGLGAVGDDTPAAGPRPSSPAAARAATPSAPPSPTPAAVVERGTGRTTVVPGAGPRRGSGPLRRYTVAVEGGLPVDAAAFAREVEATLADPRSWGSGARASFQRVASGPVTFRVVLASPDTTDRLCAPLRTGGTLSCGNGTRAVLNLRRWQLGATAYSGDLPGYRRYLVNHEVGHTLGHSHERCPGAGRLAPVMVQQTKGVGSCRANPWPYP